MAKIKRMCGLDKKDIKKQKDELLEEISKPKCYCGSCARVSTSKKLLCKPKKI